MARTPLTPAPAGPTSPAAAPAMSLAPRASGTAVLLALLTALVLVGSLAGCGGGGGLFGNSAEPLTPAADMIRRHVPHPAPVPREFTKAVLPEYRLAPGDSVLVEPARFETDLRFPADQVVMPDGTVDLGRFGRPVVAGMTIAEVEALVATRVRAVLAVDPAVTDELREQYEEDPGLLEVNVRLVDPAGSVFYVLGAVAAPGVYPLAGRETVLDAILTAGGLAGGADKHDIILSRPSVPGDCRTVLPVCYDNLVQTGDSTTNYQVLPGDRIFVPTRGCLDGIKETLCGKDCDLCACHPQFPCGPDSKGCPTPTRYAALCPDPLAGRFPVAPEPGTAARGTAIPGADGLVPPAPAGVSSLDDPADAPAPLPLDDPADAAEDAESQGDSGETPEAGDSPADATAPADDAGETTDGETEEPADAPEPPAFELPDLDDFAEGTVPDLPDLSSEGL